MNRHPIELLIDKADSAINQEDFDALIDIYSDDAVLVIKPGMNAVGKVQIRRAFEAIAAHFNHSLDVKQAGMKILESEDTALVLAKTVVSMPDMSPINRDATYVFKKNLDGAWLCVIDNSYGHELFSQEDA
ncbi:MAG: YybH family protein [Gammaproteobacteria bacterium]